MIVLFFLLVFVELSQAFTSQARFGHSAVLVNDSIYFYGGYSSVSSSSEVNQWISDLSILPIHSQYPLTDPPWKPASGPQDSMGGPFVYSHVAFLGGTSNGNMIVIGGMMPQSNTLLTDEEPTAYSYDWDLGRWNSFSLPNGNYLNRQGAACTTVEHGVAYIWGGKRTTRSPPSGLNISKPAHSSNFYRFDSIYPANSSEVLHQGKLSPPLRYAHTQTLLSDHRIIVLGGFDGATGATIPLSDIWVFDIKTSTWDQINAKLDHENKPANRSSHSQVLMQDGHSILVYGGYDGYHVYNDVAVLDTRTWTWTVKNTNAAVQGRADHTATMVGTNMIVAFGFTGVSTALTVMADIEVLDTITWSWTSVYTPSSGYNTGNTSGGKPTSIGTGTAQSNVNVPSSPSVAIVAGAMTGGLVVFLLILVAFYMINVQHQKKRRKLGKNRFSDASSSSDTSSVIVVQDVTYHPPTVPRYQLAGRNHELLEIKFKGPHSATEPFEYSSSSSRRPSAQTPHPLQICTKNLPMRSDTIGTNTTTNSSIVLLPSPWTPIRSAAASVLPDNSLSTSPTSTRFGFSVAGDSVDSSSDWAIRRAASTPTHRPMQSIASSVSKPDDRFYPQQSSLKRVATLSEVNNDNVRSSTGTQLTRETSTSSTFNSTSTSISSQGVVDLQANTATVVIEEEEEEEEEATLTCNTNSNDNNNINSNNNDNDDEDEDDALFDRQEFILQSDEVAKIEEREDESRSLGMIVLENQQLQQDGS